jgi:cold shock CspA family protein
MDTFPQHLINSVKEGTAVLFLGAGASMGALHNSGNTIPSTQGLSDQIAERFLGDGFKGRTLSTVAETAINESSLIDVQTFIRDIFSEFSPATFHKLIPTFAWKAIATTNYDLIVERAYEVKERLQDVVVFKKDGENVDSLITKPTDIPYIKLHGCITNINDIETPLILTPDQYVTHRKNREHLFNRIKELWYNNTIIFIGHSLIDHDIRIILKELEELKEAKPRSYMVSPGLTEPDKRLFEAKRITPINLSFEDFINKLNKEIEKHKRVLSTVASTASTPIYRRFYVAHAKPSQVLTSFLERDIEYLYHGFKTSHVSPKTFYKGYFQEWGAIEQKLDVKRDIEDTLLYEVFLEDEAEKDVKQELILIKGHAGSGKTVLLKRIAWDAAMEYDKFCLILKPDTRPDYDALLELYTYTKQRIFLFVDSAIDNGTTISSFLEHAKRDSLPITIITTERNNEWNEKGTDLDPFVTTQYNLEYLKQGEIVELVKLLTLHKSLGYLEDKTDEEKIDAFTKKAGRQLLVALHEATEGEPFEDIIRNEYKSIVSPEARKLYLTVCILHRLEASSRAGLISRIHGISFDNFKEELFKPLEHVVFAKKNNLTGDYAYVTRHPHIAEIVFETILLNTQDRYDEYVRIFNGLDIDYNADEEAFIKMAKARHLMNLFSDPQMIRQIYEIAEKLSHEHVALLQQEAIFEMLVPSGNLDRANSLLQTANRKAPWNKSIRHSMAELSLKKYEASSTDLEKNKYKNEVTGTIISLLTKDVASSYSYNTLLKLELNELEDLLKKKNEVLISDAIKDIEKHFTSALQKFPDDAYLLELESRYNMLVGANPKALESLSKAFQSNKRSPFIAIRLATVYSQNGNTLKGIDVLKESIEANPVDKDIHFRLATLLMESTEAITPEIKHHLRNSFTKGDHRYEAQFWYARALYLDKDYTNAKDIFLTLAKARASHSFKNRTQGIVSENGRPKRFNGVVAKTAYSFCYITREGYGDDIFAHVDSNPNVDWYFLQRFQRVEFTLAFNYKGPIAIDMKLK